MSDKPSDWAVARAFHEFSEFMYVDRDHVLARARELDDSGGAIPMDKGPWRASDDGKRIHSDDFAVDAMLTIGGDFIDDHHRKDYAAWLARTLNGATPRAAEAYTKANPLGGPATMFETIARRLRAGENYDEVMADYGLARAAEAGDKDGERYRWLRAEHGVNNPLARVTWKQNGDRTCGEWVNTASPASLDEQIDAAMDAVGAGGGE